MPSTIIFESRTLLPWKGKTIRFCLSRLGREIMLSKAGFRISGCIPCLGPPWPAFLLGANLDTRTHSFGRMPSTIIFESRTLLPLKGKTIRLCISRLGRGIILKVGFRTFGSSLCLGLPWPAFLLGANLDTRTHSFGCMPSTIIIESRTLLPLKGKTVRLCISRLGRGIILKVGFRTFGSTPCLGPPWSAFLLGANLEIMSHRFGRMPSTIIFESRTLLPWRIWQFGFVSIDWAER